MRGVATEQRPKGRVKNLKPVLRYFRQFRWQIAGAFIAIVFTSSSMLALGWVLRFMVDRGIGQGNAESLDHTFEMLLGVTAMLAVATYARFYLVSSIGERTVANIRGDIFRHLIGLDIAYFETTRTGELLSRLMTDTTLLQTVLGSSVSIAMRNVLMLIGGFALLLTTSPSLTFYVLGMLPVVIIPIIVLGRRVRQTSRNTQDKVAEMSAQAQETFSAIRAVRALSIEQEEVARFESKIEETLSTALGRIRLRALLIALVILLIFGAVLTVLWFGSKSVLLGNISPGQLSSFIFYSIVVAGSVGALSEVFAELQRAGGAAERIGELLNQLPTLTAPEQPLPLQELTQAQIRFDAVQFTYPSRPERLALAELTFTAEPGETIALVGPSGAGKTTVFQLLLRLYDPDSGAVRLNGTDIRQFDPAELRRQIGLVPQDPVLFTGTVLENIRTGNADASEEQVIHAARTASAWEFIEALPQGLATHLGEKGVQLSGGQRQRIAIARAVLKNPRILLLDEATSALDSENERLIQAALEGLRQGRTTFIIAHRLSTVRDADRILLLNEGRLEAVGTHAALLAGNALYQRLATAQFK